MTTRWTFAWRDEDRVAASASVDELDAARLSSPTMARVELTRHLFAFFPQLAGRDLEVEGETIAELVRGLDALAPGLASYLCDERGRLRTHVNIFIEGERVADRGRLTDRVDASSRVFILQALSGG